MNINSKQLNYYKEDREFSQEASTLGIRGTPDKKIFVESARTGVVKEFRHQGTQFNDRAYEEELVAWHYVAADGSDLHLIIWND